MKKFSAAFLISCSVLAFGQAAQAATFSFEADNPTAPLSGTVENFSSLTGSNSANEASSGTYATAIGSLTLNKAQIVYGAQVDEFAIPYGVSSTANYLSVYNAGTATFTISPSLNTHEFEINWGSIDPSNQITFTDAQNNSYTLTGAEIDASANGDQGINGTDLVKVFSQYAITSAVLTSGQNSFEVGAVSVSAVPVPGALPLFGSALLGVGILARRRAKKAA